jgi:hypothetical protein
LATVNQYFGTLSSIGAHAGEYPDAIDCWTYSTDKHEGDLNPPAGAVVLWGALTHPRWPGDENFAAGDICLSLGGGYVRATDYPSAGRVGTCTISQRTAQIGRPYLGWCGDFLGYQIDSLGSEAVTQEGGGFLMALTDQQQTDLYNGVSAIYACLLGVNGKLGSLPDAINLPSAIDRIYKVVAQPVQRTVDGKVQSIPQIQDNADTNTMVRGLVATIASLQSTVNALATGSGADPAAIQEAAQAGAEAALRNLTLKSA